MVARTRLNVSLYVRCLSCCILLLPFTLFEIKFLLFIPCTTFPFFSTFNERYSTYKFLLLLSHRQSVRDTWQTVALVPFISEQFSCPLSLSIPTPLNPIDPYSFTYRPGNGQ